MDQQSTRTDITVNVDGFWMLQALLDIRHVAPELRCRPYVSTDSSDWLNEHPGMAVMREQGIVEGSGGVNEVNKEVAARMRVLAAPDLEVVALLSRGKLLYGIVDDENQPPGSRDIPDNEFRVVLARRDQHWVSAVRVGNDITVDDVADRGQRLDRRAGARRPRIDSPCRACSDQRGQRADGGHVGSNQGSGRSPALMSSPAATYGEWASAPPRWPRWVRHCQIQRPRSRCTPASIGTTPKGPAPRCCR